MLVAHGGPSVFSRLCWSDLVPPWTRASCVEVMLAVEESVDDLKHDVATAVSAGVVLPCWSCKASKSAFSEAAHKSENIGSERCTACAMCCVAKKRDDAWTKNVRRSLITWCPACSRQRLLGCKIARRTCSCQPWAMPLNIPQPKLRSSWRRDGGISCVNEGSQYSTKSSVPIQIKAMK